MHYEFRMGERDVDPKLVCTECGGRAEGEHSWTDGSGEICNACVKKDAESTPSPKGGCVFDLAYCGPCGKPTGESIYGMPPNQMCEKHTFEDCARCHKPAVRQCESTFGPGCCGESLCKDCGCTYVTR